MLVSLNYINNSGGFFFSFFLFLLGNDIPCARSPDYMRRSDNHKRLVVLCKSAFIV